MTLPGLPAQGDTNWYAHYTALHSEVATQGSPELWDVFAFRSSGTPVIPGRGGPWVLLGSSSGAADSSAAPTVASGKLTKPAGAPSASAGYASLPLAHPLTRIGAKFSLTAYTGGGTNNGAAGIMGWAGNIASTFPLIPDSPCHLVIGPNSWAYGVFVSNALFPVASGTFATPLTADGVTEHTCEVWIDRPNGVAYVNLPDGTTVRVADSRIGSIAATYAGWEYYQGAAGDTVAAFSEVWADSTLPHAGYQAARSGALITPPPVVVQWAPGTNSDITVPTSDADVSAANLSATINIPYGYTRYKVELNANLVMTTNVAVLWGYRDGTGGGALALRRMIDQQYSGALHFSHIRTGLSPGNQTVVWRHFATGAGATFKADAPNGYLAQITLTALP